MTKLHPQSTVSAIIQTIPNDRYALGGSVNRILYSYVDFGREKGRNVFARQEPVRNVVPQTKENLELLSVWLEVH